ETFSFHGRSRPFEVAELLDSMKKVSSEFVTHLLNTQPPKGGTTNFTRFVTRPSDQRRPLGALAASRPTPPRPTTIAPPAKSSAGRSPPIRTAGRRAGSQSALP